MHGRMAMYGQGNCRAQGCPSTAQVAITRVELERGMRYTNIAPGKHQVFNVFGNHAAQRKPPGRRRRVVGSGISVLVIKASRKVIVHGPAGVGHDIVKMPAGLYVVLR